MLPTEGKVTITIELSRPFSRAEKVVQEQGVQGVYSVALFATRHGFHVTAQACGFPTVHNGDFSLVTAAFYHLSGPDPDLVLLAKTGCAHGWGLGSSTVTGRGLGHLARSPFTDRTLRASSTNELLQFLTEGLVGFENGVEI